MTTKAPQEGIPLKLNTTRLEGAPDDDNALMEILDGVVRDVQVKFTGTTILDSNH